MRQIYWRIAHGSHKWHHLCAAIVAMTMVSGCATTKFDSEKPLPKSAELQGRISDVRLNETSGLAASQRQPNWLWAINDSNNRPELFRLSLTANVERQYALDIKNRDWEAMASIRYGHKPYLLIADTGDNLKIHKVSYLHAFEEPNEFTSDAQPLQPTHTLAFRYENGSHNVEAMGVSKTHIFLFTKERLQNHSTKNNSRIFEIPLATLFDATAGDASNQTRHIAQKIGQVTLPRRSIDVSVLSRLLKIDPIQPTDVVISEDELSAYMLNYIHVLHYRRLPHESWPQAFSRPPKLVRKHRLRQAEAITIDKKGTVWVTSEGQYAPLIALKPAS